jgi:hypothetical protein
MDSSGKQKYDLYGQGQIAAPRAFFGSDAQILCLSQLALGRFQHPESASHHGETGK